MQEVVEPEAPPVASPPMAGVGRPSMDTEAESSAYVEEDEVPLEAEDVAESSDPRAQALKDRHDEVEERLEDVRSAGQVQSTFEHLKP